MARIRSIKPEFWSSPGIEDLDPKWRLLFIAMWQWADDYGRGTAEPRELMGFAFPRDENMTVGEFRRGLGGIHRVFGVKFYHFSKRPYYAIPSWEKHQKIDKRAKASKYPDPDDGVEFDPENGQVIDHSPVSSMGSSEDSGGSAGLSGNSGAGTVEQGNRGTGEQEELLPEPPVPATEPKPKRATYPPEFDEWWRTYPKHKNGSKKDAYAEWRKATKIIDPDELLRLTAEYADNPGVPDIDYCPDAHRWLKGRKWETVSETDHHVVDAKPQHTFGTRPEDWLQGFTSTASDNVLEGEVVSWPEIEH